MEEEFQTHEKKTTPGRSSNRPKDRAILTRKNGYTSIKEDRMEKSYDSSHDGLVERPLRQREGP